MTSIKSVWMAAVCAVAMLCCTSGAWADGACCLPDGTCVEVPLATDCQAMGGAFSGQESSCAVIDCFGACCLPDGSCEQRTERDCIVNAFGDFQGNGIGCYNGQCDSFTGACTMPDGTCSQLEFLDCDAMGGYWRGFNTECGALDHDGACCFPDGTCTPSQTQDQCTGAGGNFQGFGSNCPAGDCFQEKYMIIHSEESPVPQPQPEVALMLPRFNEGPDRELQKVTLTINCSSEFVNIICNTNKSIGNSALNYNVLQQIEVEALTPPLGLTCLDENGTLTCGMPPFTTIEPGDCCDYGSTDNGAAGQFTDSVSMMFMPPGDDLSGFIVNGGNMFTTTLEGTSSWSPVETGFEFSNDTRMTYEIIVCYEFAPKGACCLPLPGNGCIITTEDDCASQGGTYQGDGTDCLPEGACCLPDGSCIEVSETCCDDYGGTFLGGNCSPNSGACCLPDGTCIDVNETCCIDQGGTFIGGNCSPDTGACCLPNGTCVETNETCCIAQGGDFVGGPCGNVGACCLPDGSCIQTPEACCDFANGVFIGGKCSPNTGACCLPDGTCVEVNETCCIDQGGEFIGGACSPDSGACCLPDGTCVEVNQTCCLAQGGDFIGGVCSPDSGACCLPDGTCVEVNETCCIGLGGTFIGGDCSPNSGACCLPDGTCVDVNETCCIGLGGTFIGGDCSPNSGACCLPDGTCVEINETCCIDQGGEFIGGDCSPNSGACCLPDGSCVEINETCCIDQGGDFIGGNCGAIGACCLPDGSCVETSQACCTNLGGEFIGGDCGPVGACCLPDGTCVEIPEACCLDEGGDFVGAGTQCGGTGACCFPDGSCSIEIEACCEIAGGSFVGDGTVCGAMGACCLPDGTCLPDQHEACCEQIGGEFQGAGESCDDITCDPDDGGCEEKGSLVIFSKVEIRWDANGNLLQDTFLQLTNDFPDNVSIQLYFVNGDPPLAATPDEREHPGWNWVDNEIELTADQPTYWSALTGLGSNGPQDPTLSPFTVLDPGFPPGRPDPEVPGERMLRGFIVAWAVEQSSNIEIRWNHLAGNGTLVHYRDGWSWEYRTCGIPVVANVAHGEQTGLSPGELHLDNAEYRSASAELLMNFQAVNSSAFSGSGPVLINSTTDVTLHPIDADLRQETDGPVTTKAHYSVWNQNELKLSGAFRCITCWDQSLLSSYGTPNHFFLNTLQTDHGKARIDGRASALCNVDLHGPGGPGTPPDGVPDVVSQDAALLGLTARLMSIDAGANHAADGTNMFGMGGQDAVIKYDPSGIPPELFDKMPQTPEEFEQFFRMLSGEVPGVYPRQ